MCGTYELQPDGETRIGSLSLLVGSSAPLELWKGEADQVTEHVSLAGVFDVKWHPTMPIVACACSDGWLHMYAMSASGLYHIGGVDCNTTQDARLGDVAGVHEGILVGEAPPPMALSVCWQQPSMLREPVGPSMCSVTMSNGNSLVLHLLISSKEGEDIIKVSLQRGVRWRAHSEACWTSLMRHAPDVTVMTGGDDMCMCAWHVDCSDPVQKSDETQDVAHNVTLLRRDRTSHEAGVTALWQSRTNADEFASGVRSVSSLRSLARHQPCK